MKVYTSADIQPGDRVCISIAGGTKYKVLKVNKKSIICEFGHQKLRYPITGVMKVERAEQDEPERVWALTLYGKFKGANSTGEVYCRKETEEDAREYFERYFSNYYELIRIDDITETDKGREILSLSQ